MGRSAGRKNQKNLQTTRGAIFGGATLLVETRLSLSEKLKLLATIQKEAIETGKINSEPVTFNFSKEKITDSYMFGVNFSDHTWEESELENVSFSNKNEDLPANLNGSRFISSSLSAVSFANCQIARSVFEATKIKQSYFNDCNMTGSRFGRESVFLTTNFDSANLEDALFDSGSRFPGSKFYQTKFSDNVSFSGVELPQAVFSKINFKNPNFSETNLYDTLFSVTDMQDPDFSQAQLERTRFLGDRQTTLDRPRFLTDKMIDVIFMRMRIKNATFRVGEIYKTDFRDIEIERSSFSDSKLSRMKFINCILTDVDFSQASMSDIDFESCTFKNCKFPEKSSRVEFYDCEGI